VITFPGLEKRIDWVLVSPGLVITEHVVLDESVSDHRAVRVRIRREKHE